MDIIYDGRLLQWFDLLDLSENTKRLYLIYMRQFCNCLSKSPTELITEAIAETKGGLLLSERQTVGYVARFKKTLKENRLAPNSQAAAMTCVKSFYKAFDIELSSAIKKSKKCLPLKENMGFLTKPDLKKLITNAKSLRDKAIILFMATSGMARSEILNLRIRDITFDQNDVGIINIRRQKTQTDYTTFISPEATVALRNYTEERNRSDALKVKGQNDFVFVTYPAVGGKGGGRIKQPTFTLIFKQLAVQLGYNNDNFQITTKSHALRKFFATTLENAGMPKNKIDFMLGHTPNGNDLGAAEK